MKLPKKIHLTLILVLAIGLLYDAFQIEWNQLFDDTFEWNSLQGFSVSLLVLFVLIFQYKSTATKPKQKDEQ
jgi:hypothetical protein